MRPPVTSTCQFCKGTDGTTSAGATRVLELEVTDLPVGVLGDREEVTDTGGVDPLAVRDVAVRVGGPVDRFAGAGIGDLLEPRGGRDPDLVLGRDRLHDAGLLPHALAPPRQFLAR